MYPPTPPFLPLDNPVGVPGLVRELRGPPRSTVRLPNGPRVRGTDPRGKVGPGVLKGEEFPKRNETDGSTYGSTALLSRSSVFPLVSISTPTPLLGWTGVRRETRGHLGSLFHEVRVRGGRKGWRTCLESCTSTVETSSSCLPPLCLRHGP